MEKAPKDFVIGLCQYKLDQISEFDHLLQRIEAQFSQIREADLVVLPELVVNDYTGSPDSDLEETTLSQSETEEYHAFLQQWANKLEGVIVGGSYNTEINGDIFNRCPIASPSETVTTYDKMCPTPGERDRGKSMGDVVAPTIIHNGVNLSVANCYDVEFPEYVTEVANSGLDILVVPTWTSSEAGYQRVRRCSMSRAVENCCLVVQTCLIGIRPDGTVDATGRSGVYAPCDDVNGPHGTRLSLPRDEHAVVTYQANIQELRRAKKSAKTVPARDSEDVFDL